MSFQRTPSGLTNLHLFYGADAVVFVEGGESYSVHEITQGKFNPHSHDVKFWSTLFSRFRPDLQYHFRAVGSKASLVALVSYVLANHIRKVIICIDRDLDHLIANQQAPGFIVRTFGYSWENCVWTKEVVLAVFQKLNSSGEDTSAVQKEVDTAFSDCRCRLCWFVHGHCLLAAAGGTTDIEKSLGALTKSAARPQVNRGYLLNLVKAGHARIGTVTLPTQLHTEPLIDCYGHLIGRFGYQLLAYLLRKHSGIRTLPIDVATPVAIDEAIKIMAGDPARTQHYSSRLSALAP